MTVKLDVNRRLLRCWPTFGERNAFTHRLSLVYVNTATQPGIRKDTYYFKVRFVCASNNQTRCAIRDKFVEKVGV